MQEYRKNILCTRPVTVSLVEEAGSNGIALDIISFIETEAIENIEVQQEVEQAATQLTTVVFTSMNAVTAVTDILEGHIPDWNIYSIGHKTKQLVEAYFGNAAIAGTADSALALAGLIVEDDQAEEVFFFCGDQRRHELPDKLEAYGISVNEIIVYRTITVAQKIDKRYDGILFFSPSAVGSFFEQNKLPEQTIVFAIGNTTQQAIRKYCSNEIILSRSPAKEALVMQAIKKFTSH